MPASARGARGGGGDVRGLYVHIPFCARRCNFCDFVTGPDAPGRADAYLDAVLREARAERAALAETPPLATLFLGGGTPSLVPPRRLVAFLSELAELFPLAPGAEATLEANPEDLDAEHLDAYRGAGINRLSVGIQSLDGATLAALNRRHTPGEGLAGLRRAREAGFENRSVDLMLGIPGESEARFQEGVESVLDEGIAHLSVYALTVEERSVFGRRARSGRFVEEPDERFERLYSATIDRAARAGLEHYEISNFARPGFRAAHNVLYWERASVLGIGVGAVGSAGGQRWRNVGSIERYLRHAGVPPREWDDRGIDARATEALFLGLRLRAGIDLAELEREFGPAIRAAVGPAIAAHAAGGRLEAAGRRVRLTRAGLLLSDAVFRDLTLLPGDLARAARASVPRGATAEPASARA
jgi:oxygen-independent coproporphyrinogen-3 oxidase